MPIYQCVTSLTLSPKLKAAIAKEITRIHVEFTAAPEPFVNVVFSDLPLGSHYLAGAVRENGTLINAIIRAGRTLETRQALLKSLSAAWSRLTGQPERKLVIRV
jgi:phenylpyruvate tautomerase PptA (4-oxalocrotonate tautomerase family)